MKMSVVGCEASGKTVFLSALADYYNGDGRPCLVPENEAANRFQRFQFRQMRSLHQWPAATHPGKTIELKWSLRDNGKTLDDIDLLEFGGETYREAFRGEKASESHQAAVDALKQHLCRSDFVVILASLKDLLRDSGELSSEEFERDTEAIWVTRGLLNFLKENAPSAHVVVGLTQADLHRDEIEAAGGAEKLFLRHWPSVASVVHGRPVLPVASVSATDANGNPAPDYTTDGILPVMEEFKKVKRGPRHSSGNGTPGNLRPALLLLLLAACGALWFEYGRTPSPVPASDRVTFVERIVQTNFVENLVTTTSVVENVVTATNLVFNVVTTTNVIENVVTTTNVVEKIVLTTNAAEDAVAAIAVPTNATESAVAPTKAADKAEESVGIIDDLLPKAPPPLRTWHDHNGTAIDARWISTTDDGKRIVIETVSGRRIRAAIRKFSAADQQYIRERLNPSGRDQNPKPTELRKNQAPRQ